MATTDKKTPAPKNLKYTVLKAYHNKAGKIVKVGTEIEMPEKSGKIWCDKGRLKVK